MELSFWSFADMCNTMCILYMPSLQQQTTKNWGESEAQYVIPLVHKVKRKDFTNEWQKTIELASAFLTCNAKNSKPRKKKTNIAQFEKQSKKFDKPKFSTGRNWFWARQRDRDNWRKKYNNPETLGKRRTELWLLNAYQVFRRPLRVEILYVLITLLILVFPPAFVGSHTTSPLSVKQLGLDIFVSD